MKLAVVNGSPRGRKSNSDRIIGWLTDEEHDMLKVYTADIKKQDDAAKDVAAADSILFVFPLYTDMMPGSLKAFLEKLNKYDLSGKTATFVVHSGFPEAIHSRTVEKYCRYFAKSKGMKLLGSVVMGGSEALQGAPDEFYGKRFKKYAVIKQNISDQTELDTEAVKIIARPERLSKARAMMAKVSLIDIYWNSQLKKNGVYKKRYAKPYLEE